MNCVLCGKEIEEEYLGNNPWPMADDGRCCAECNDRYVIPGRLYLHTHPGLGPEALAETMLSLREWMKEKMNRGTAEKEE